MNKIQLLLIICFSILNGDDITSSCKDFEHQKCLSNGWKFETENHKNSLKNYEKAKILNEEKSLVQSYKHIVQARDIIQNEQILKSKMKKKIYSGSALRPRVKTYKTKIKNIYNIKSLELNTTSKNTAQPILIVECSKNENSLYVHNINKSFKKNENIPNMNLVRVAVHINGETYNIDKVKSGEFKKINTNIQKCDNLRTSLTGNNSLFDEQAISKISLIKVEDI